MPQARHLIWASCPSTPRSCISPPHKEQFPSSSLPVDKSSIGSRAKGFRWAFGVTKPVRRSDLLALRFHLARDLATCVELEPLPGFLLSYLGPVSVRLPPFRLSLVLLLKLPIPFFFSSAKP